MRLISSRLNPLRAISAAPVQLLSYATSSNFLFTSMSESERADVFMLFERYPVKAGDVVVRQAEPGDYFYVVESGQYDVFVHAGMDPPLLVHTYSSASGQPVSKCGGRRGSGKGVSSRWRAGVADRRWLPLRSAVPCASERSGLETARKNKGGRRAGKHGCQGLVSC
jgi:hypothetical protein